MVFKPLDVSFRQSPLATGRRMSWRRVGGRELGERREWRLEPMVTRIKRSQCVHVSCKRRLVTLSLFWFFLCSPRQVRPRGFRPERLSFSSRRAAFPAAKGSEDTRAEGGNEGCAGSGCTAKSCKSGSHVKGALQGHEAFSAGTAIPQYSQRSGDDPQSESRNH